MACAAAEPAEAEAPVAPMLAEKKRKEPPIDDSKGDSKRAKPLIQTSQAPAGAKPGGHPKKPAAQETHKPKTKPGLAKPAKLQPKSATASPASERASGSHGEPARSTAKEDKPKSDGQIAVLLRKGLSSSSVVSLPSPAPKIAEGPRKACMQSWLCVVGRPCDMYDVGACAVLCWWGVRVCQRFVRGEGAKQGDEGEAVANQQPEGGARGREMPV